MWMWREGPAWARGRAVWSGVYMKGRGLIASIWQKRGRQYMVGRVTDGAACGIGLRSSSGCQADRSYGSSRVFTGQDSSSSLQRRAVARVGEFVRCRRDGEPCRCPFRVLTRVRGEARWNVRSKARLGSQSVSQHVDGRSYFWPFVLAARVCFGGRGECQWGELGVCCFNEV